MNSFYRHRLLVVLSVGLLIGLPALQPTSAQSLRPSVKLTQLTPGTYAALDLLRQSDDPTVGLFFSEATTRHLPDGDVRVQEAVRQWEILLMGLNLPYRILSEDDLNDGVPDELTILVLPAAEAVSDALLAHLNAFLDAGGGLLALGQTARFDQAGRPRRNPTFRMLFEANRMPPLPRPTDGVVQLLEHPHRLTAGLPPGYALSLNTPDPLMVAQPIQSHALGHLRFSEDESVRVLDEGSLVLYSAEENDAAGAGAFVWLGFLPQHVIATAEHLEVYQRLIVNALGFLAQTPTVAVRTWPDGYESATAFVGLPAVGLDPRYGATMTYALDALDDGDARATFFVTTEEARFFPDLLTRIDLSGESEIGISADTDALLYGTPPETQYQRLWTALTTLETHEISGVYPPGGLFDDHTLGALQSHKFRYLLSSAPSHQWAPVLHDSTDESEEPPLLEVSMTGTTDFELLREGNEQPEALYDAYLGDFNTIHAAGGLFVLPFHPELLATSPDRATVLSRMADQVRTEGSWIATLSEIDTWWRQRLNVSVKIVDLNEESFTLTVENQNRRAVSNLSLDLWPPATFGGPLAVAGAEAVIQVQPPRHAVLTLPTLPPGQTRLVVSRGSTLATRP